MTSAEMRQFEIMSDFFGRLCDLTDSDLMLRKHAEMELRHSLKAVNAELSRRNREV